ncbi:MAG: dTDP-4-dehydrorhamnose reductase [Verrucomicrobia bacterium]|jgi:dTDP-4-dehydrorhamnose reductase|nr:dTDP-4-dehydrorhamnose reductase [Verrucomicrobiota bacterium]
MSGPTPKKVLITGADGLLAQAMKALNPSGFTLVFRSRSEFDLQNPGQMAGQLDALQPALVINTAAYNLVDKCEVERDLSWAINATGPQALAGLCAQRGIQLIHYGTDYIFDGAQRVPYTEADQPNAINHYAAGKLAGEQAVLAASPHHLVLRTSWLFGINPIRSQRSYIHAIVRQALDGKPIRATTDQQAAPTYVGDLAAWTFELAAKPTGGLYHAVNDGGLSRFDWTKEILAAAQTAGLISAVPPVEPVTTAFFNSTIRRSTYSWLSNAKLTASLGHPLGSWKTGMDAMLRQPLWPEAGR